MSKRTRLKLHNFWMYMIKYVFNGRYIVRNILALTIICTMVAAISGITAVVGSGKSDNEEAVAVAQAEDTGYEINISKMASMNPSSVSMLVASLDTDTQTDIQPNDTQVVAEPQKVPFVVIAEDGIFVREAATTDSAMVGSLSLNDTGDVLSDEGEWLNINVCDITGYVKSEYVLTGDDALEYIAANVTDSDTASDKTDTASSDNKKQSTTTEQPSTDKTTTTEKATTEQPTTEQPTTEAPANNSTTVGTTTRDSITLSDADINLMASVMTLECGGESYEGQLAVANVILNRYLSGAYGSTMSDVCYAPGQFSVVGTSSFYYYVQNGAQASCLQAARDALAGNNNIGSYTQFRPVSNVNTGNLSSYTIIGNHVFF